MAGNGEKVIFLLLQGEFFRIVMDDPDDSSILLFHFDGRSAQDDGHLFAFGCFQIHFQRPLLRRKLCIAYTLCFQRLLFKVVDVKNFLKLFSSDGFSREFKNSLERRVDIVYGALLVGDDDPFIDRPQKRSTLLLSHGFGQIHILQDI